jgi:hypothetical protein
MKLTYFEKTHSDINKRILFFEMESLNEPQLRSSSIYGVKVGMSFFEICFGSELKTIRD